MMDWQFIDGLSLRPLKQIIVTFDEIAYLHLKHINEMVKLFA
jgi:hypothetical protein